MGGADVDQAGLFAAGDDFDGEAQGLLQPGQQFGSVLRHPQGVGGHHPHGVGGETPQALAEQAQGGDGPFLGGFVEVFVGGQAGSEPDRLLEGIQGIDLVVHHPPDLQAEAVGAQIDGGNQFIAHAAGSLFSGSCSVGEPSF